jgi:hypothetical protein
MTACAWCGKGVEAEANPALCEECFEVAQWEGRQ